MKKVVSGIMLTVLLISMLTLAFNIHLSKAKGTMYIRTDGSVDAQSIENFDFSNTACKINNSDSIVKSAETASLIETMMFISENLNWEKAVYAGTIFNKKTKADLETLIENYSVAGDWLNVLKWSAICKKLDIEHEAAIKAALDNLGMVGPLPWTTTYNSKAYFCVEEKYALLGYYYAEKYNYRLDKWNKTLAYIFFRTAIYNNAKPALFIDADGNTWTISYGPRYYDEAACTVQCFLIFYELGISDALNDALNWWNWINTNLWYQETHFKYGLNWADYECEAGFFAKIIANLRYYKNDLGNWSRVLVDLQNRFLINGWDSKQWFSQSENRTTYVVIHHYPSNSQRRLQNTIGAWVSLFSLFGDFNDSSKITMQNLLKGYPELEPAWRLLMNNTAKLYDNVSNKFRWVSDASVSDDASAYALTLMFLMGIVPKTAVLAFPIEEYSYEYFYDIDPELYNIDFENKTIRVSLLEGGELEFIYGTSASSFNFPSKGIYTIVFSNDWNTIVNVSKLQELPNNRKFINPRTTSRTIVVPDDYPTIQEAINAATEGDTIFCKKGVYYGSLIVNKTVLLIGEDRESTIIDGQEIGNVILVTSCNVTIINFTITNSSIQDCGICLFSVQGCTISNCDVTRNHFGILLYSSSNNTISSNSITDNWDGITLDYYSTENLICENQVTKNMDCGIYLYLSANNTLRNNWLTDNFGSGILIFTSPNNILRNNSISGGFANFGVWDPDELLPNFIQDIDTSNTVNGKPIYYLVNEKNKKVPPDAGCVYAISSSNIIAENLNLTNNYHGILFFSTTNSSILNNNITANSYGIKLCYSLNNTISENRVVSNRYGVRLDMSSNNNLICKNSIVDNEKLYGILIDSSLNNIVCQNTITNDKSGILICYYSHYNRVYGNNIANNALYGIVVRLYSNSNVLSENNVINNWCGIRIEDTSSNNIICHNNFINNTKAFGVSGSAINIWDDGYPSGGNYWSDYTGVDLYSGPYQNLTGSDGIGDTPYVIDTNNADGYPLTAPFTVFNAGVWNGTEYFVNVISNSTVSSFVFDPSKGPYLKFNVTGDYRTIGFCRVTIPKSLLWAEDGWTITINNQQITNYTETKDENNTYLYFTYHHSTHTIVIQGTNVIPEFPSTLYLLGFLMLLTIPFTFAKKRFKEANT